jgi:ABC-type amino acid transport system permease subunit
MGWLEGVLSTLGINISAVVFGFFGALLHALRAREKHWLERWVAFTVGFVLASVAPTVVIKYFTLAPDPAYFSALGFVFGYFGMAMVDAGSEALAGLKGINWRESLQSWINRKGGGGG